MRSVDPLAAMPTHVGSAWLPGLGIRHVAPRDGVTADVPHGALAYTAAIARRGACSAPHRGQSLQMWPNNSPTDMSSTLATTR